MSTRSRDLPEAKSSDHVAGIMRDIPEEMHLFKKIDSRLKGNIAAELSALPDVPILVVPAIPQFGRFQIGGEVSGCGLDTAINLREVLGYASAGRRRDIPIHQWIL